MRVRFIVCCLWTMLSMDTQIVFVVRSAYFHFRQIAQLCPFLYTRSFTMLVHTLVISRLDHGNILYTGLPRRLSWKLQETQNMVARLLTGVNKHHRITPILATLHWLSVHFCTSFNVMFLTYKAINSLRPSRVATSNRICTSYKNIPSKPAEDANPEKAPMGKDEKLGLLSGCSLMVEGTPPLHSN